MSPERCRQLLGPAACMARLCVECALFSMPQLLPLAINERTGRFPPRQSLHNGVLHKAAKWLPARHQHRIQPGAYLRIQDDLPRYPLRQLSPHANLSFRVGPVTFSFPLDVHVTVACFAWSQVVGSAGVTQFIGCLESPQRYQSATRAGT